MTASDVQKLRTAIAILRGYAENEAAEGLLDVVEAGVKRNVAHYVGLVAQHEPVITSVETRLGFDVAGLQPDDVVVINGVRFRREA